MRTKAKLLSLIDGWRGMMRPSHLLVLALGIILAVGATQSWAADEAAAQKMMTEARAKEAHAQELRAAAAATLQKAADDQMEASAEERDARILSAQALKLSGADENKQHAFKLRVEARKLSSQSHLDLINARNAEQKAAQLSHNAEELRKSAAQLKDQPSVASTLENEAKEQETQAQTESQTANTDKFSAQALEGRAKNAWAAAEKLDPEAQHQAAPASPKPVLVQPRQVK